MNPSPDICDLAKQLTPSEWHQLLVRSGETNGKTTLSGIELPKYPPEQIQMNLNGRPASQSMPHGRDLYIYTMSEFDRSVNFRKTGKYLDYGAGWGRIWRYFLRDFSFENCYAYDVNPNLLDLWDQINLSGKIHIGRAYEPLPYLDQYFDVVTSNSVWSHLSEELALDSLAKLRRTMKTGALLVLTTFGLKHLNNWKKMQSGEMKILRPGLKNITSNMDEMIKKYEDGEFVYISTGKERTHLVDYQLAAIPEKWFKTNVEGFKIIDFDNGQLPQSAVKLQAI